jgi:drug/metabolite transporter (DMT)-like permease
LSPAQIGCGVTILIGVGLALSPGKDSRLKRREVIIGVLFALLGAVGNAFGAVLSRKAYAIAHENLETVTGHDAAFQRIAGGLAVAGICLLVVKRGRFPGYPETREISKAQSSNSADGASDLSRIKRKWLMAGPWILANSLAGQTLGVSCMQKAFESTPTGVVLSIIATTPIVVMPLAYVFEGERPTRRSIAGGIVAVCGVILLVLNRG